MTVTATAQGDTAANGILKAIGVGVYKQDGTLAKLTDLGITNTSQLKDAVYTYPNGTTAHVKLGYYLNAVGQQVTDFNDAVELAYYVHPNDQNYSLFTDGKGADAGVNDKVDLNQSGASATYGLSISWDAKNFDNFAAAQHVVRGFAQPVYGSYSPQVIKEFYVDQDTGEQISPMTLLGEHGNFTDQYTVDSDNLSSLGYTLRSSYMYHQQETGGYTAQDVSNIWPAFKLDQQPAALVHYYVKTTDASNVVHFIDVDDSNKEVAVTSDGKHAYDITGMVEYNNKQEDLLAQGYEVQSKDKELVELDTPLDFDGPVIKHPDGVIEGLGMEVPKGGRNLYVYLKHGTEVVTPEKPKDGVETSKTVTRTVNFVDSLNRTIAPSVTQTAHFTREVTVDKVTGKEISATDWQSTDATFTAVSLPEVNGWIAPKKTVDGETVSATTGDQTETVQYKSTTDLYYEVTMYDVDDNDKILYHDKLLGTYLNPKALDGFGAFVDNAENAGAALEASGYEYEADKHVFSDSTEVVNGRTVDSQINKSYFHHKMQTVTPENPENGVETSKTVTRTINYVDAKGKTVAPSVTQTAHFTRNVTIDAVTKAEKSATAWQSTDANFEAVTSPTLEDRITKQTTVAAETVDANTDNQTVTVIYDNPALYIERRAIVDLDTNTVLMDLSHRSDDSAESSYHFVDEVENTAASILEDKYVEAYKNSSKTISYVDGKAVSYDDQTIYVHHATEVVTPEKSKDGVETSKTVTRTVNFVDSLNRTIAPSVTQTAHFTREVTVDKVTGKEISATDWQSTDATFTAVSLPEVNGWIAPKKTVDGETVTATTGDQTETVQYESTTDLYTEVTMYDVDDNDKILYHDKLLETRLDPKTIGRFDAFVDYLENAGAALEASGYENEDDKHVFSASTDVVNGRTVDSQINKVYFRHKMQTVTPENPENGVETSKTVTRTINYVDAKGKTVAPSVTQTAHFTRNVTIDAVTKAEKSATAWQSTDANFEAVTSPTLEDRITKQTTVAAETVNADAQNQVVTVTYTKNAPTPVDPTPAPAPTPVDPTPAPAPTPVDPTPAPAPTPVDPTPAPAPTPVDPTPAPAPTPVDPTPAPAPTPVDPTPAPTPTPVDPTPAPAPTPVDPTPAPTPTPVDPTPAPAPTPVDPTPAPAPTPVDPTPAPAPTVKPESTDNGQSATTVVLADNKENEALPNTGAGETTPVKPGTDNLPNEVKHDNVKETAAELPETAQQSHKNAALALFSAATLSSLSLAFWFKKSDK